MRYAVGDIHGCIDTLKTLIEEKIKPTKNDVLIFLGDYIDRGKNSKAVLDYLNQLVKTGYQVILLRGNHEEMLLNAFNSYDNFLLWYYNGASSTFSSFGMNLYSTIEWLKIQQIPSEYIDFIKRTEYYYLMDDFWLVHAGFNFKHDNMFKDFHSMVWIREIIPDENVLKDKKIVHAHTPVPLKSIRLSVNDKSSKIINIDGGCVYNHKPGLGNLVALNLDSLDIIYTPNVD
jgi:serine/threonine protein phosphatase 1